MAAARCAVVWVTSTLTAFHPRTGTWRLPSAAEARTRLVSFDLASSRVLRSVIAAPGMACRRFERKTPTGFRLATTAEDSGNADRCPEVDGVSAATRRYRPNLVEQAGGFRRSRRPDYLWRSCKAANASSKMCGWNWPA